MMLKIRSITQGFCLIFTVSVSLLVCNGCSNKNVKPNVIFFLADDLGYTDLGVMGSEYYLTPNIDQLAKEGISFTHAYANAPNCAPGVWCLSTTTLP